MTATARGAFYEVTSCLKQLYSFLKIDDVDTVSCTEDEWLHLGVPAFGLVTIVDACFEQVFHVDCNSH